MTFSDRVSFHRVITFPRKFVTWGIHKYMEQSFIGELATITVGGIFQLHLEESFLYRNNVM